MIKRYTDLALFKTDIAPSEPNMKDPYYELVAKIPNTNEKVTSGKFWFKRSDKGLNYFSGQMKKEYINQAGAKFEGYVIVSAKDLDELEAKVSSKSESLEDVSRQFDNGAVNPADVPF